MSPANASGKLSDRSPLQAVSLTNMGANKASPSKQPPPHFQVTTPIKMCSVTLDLLHTCEFCDKDFVSMERLMEHMSVCRRPTDGGAAPAKRRLERACVQGSTLAHPPTPQASPKKSIPKRKIDFAHKLQPKKKCLSPRIEPALIDKKHFMEGFGLVPKDAIGSPKISKSEGPKFKTWKMPNKVLRMIPFTHLPKELHLRNFSFQPSSRLEAINAEKIAHNWMRIDALAPAYPVNHRRYLPLIPKGQTFQIVDEESGHWLRRRTSLASKKSLSPAPSCSVIQKKMTSPRKGYRVRLLRLTEADIWKAEHGIDLPGIINRYKGQVRKLDKTELDIMEREPERRPPAINRKTRSKTMPVVSLERLPSNVVAISKNSPVKASCPSEVAKSFVRTSPRQLESRITLRGSPRRLLLASLSVDLTDDDSDDEVMFLGCFSNIN